MYTYRQTNQNGENKDNQGRSINVDNTVSFENVKYLKLSYFNVNGLINSLNYPDFIEYIKKNMIFFVY